MNTPRIRHEMDEDGCCTYCGTDLAEAHWLRSQTHPDDREPAEEWELYCVRKEADVRSGKVAP
jgi:hypothetical protein